MPVATVILLGLVNWLATTICVESEITRPLRGWVADRQYLSPKQLHPSATITKRTTLRVALWRKLGYLLSCHLCAGTWIGLAQAAVLGSPWGGFTGWVAGGLLFKAIGHLTLELRPQAWLPPRRSSGS